MSKFKLSTVLLMITFGISTFLVSCQRDDTTFTFINNMENLRSDIAVTLFEYDDRGAPVGQHDIHYEDGIPDDYKKMFVAHPRGRTVVVEFKWERQSGVGGSSVTEREWIYRVFHLRVTKNTDIRIYEGIETTDNKPRP